MIELVEENGGVLVPVKVVPNASRDRIVGELDGALMMTVSAVAERGKVNRAVCKLISKTMELWLQQVSVEAGHPSPHKSIRISGATLAAVRTSLLGSTRLE